MEEIVKKDIRALDKEALRAFFVTQGQSAFRGNQVYEWLWQKGAHSFESMTNISKETRAFLIYWSLTQRNGPLFATAIHTPDSP